MPLADQQSTLLLQVWYPASQLRSADSTLSVRGDGFGLSWERGVPLERASADLWRCRLSPSERAAAGVGGQHSLQLKVLVNDSLWQIGANVVAEVPNRPSMLDVYPSFYSHAGHYEVVHDVHSPQLGNDRSIAVYLPPSYFENTLTPPYPVLVMHDGQNLFDASVSTFGATWRCRETLDSLINQGAVREFVVVGVYNTPDRFNEVTVKGDAYLDFIQHTVLPMIQKRYRVRLDRGSLGILGSSLGGLISTYAGWTRPDVWGRVGHLSIQLNCDDCREFNLHLRDTVLRRHEPAPRDTVFYLDSGVPCEGDGDQISSVVSIMAERIPAEHVSTFIDYGGQHNEETWANRLHVPLTRLYPPAVLSSKPIDLGGAAVASK